jgi:hypothetical protein
MVVGYLLCTIAVSSIILFVSLFQRLKYFKIKEGKKYFLVKPKHK